MPPPPPPPPRWLFSLEGKTFCFACLSPFCPPKLRSCPWIACPPPPYPGAITVFLKGGTEGNQSPGRSCIGSVGKTVDSQMWGPWFKSPGSCRLTCSSAFGQGTLFHTHCLVPQKGLKSVGPWSLASLSSLIYNSGLLRHCFYFYFIFLRFHFLKFWAHGPACYISVCDRV